MIRFLRYKPFLALSLVFSTWVSMAQTPPPVDETSAMKHVSALTAIGKRSAGSEGGRKAAAYVKAQVQAYGLNVEEHRFPILVFDDLTSTATCQGKTVPLAAIAGSPAAHLEAEMAQVFPPGNDADFARANVKGKIALVPFSNWPSTRMKVISAAKAGALAVLLYSDLCFQSSNCGDPAPIPALAMYRKDAEPWLEALKSGPVTLKLDSETRVEKGEGINLIATMKGTSPEVLVFGAHYDSVTVATGADDNASGTAVILELARTLARAQRPETLQFIAFDAEERGLAGSAAYVKSLSSEQKKAIKAMHNFDCVGTGASAFDISGDKKLVKRAIKAVETLGGVARKSDMENSDHASFLDAKIPAVFFFRDGGGYHTPKDTIEGIQPSPLVMTARVALAMLQE